MRAPRAHECRAEWSDADDAWHPCKLEIQIGWMEMHPEAAMTATLRPHVDRLSDLPEPADPIGVRELSFRATLMRNRIPTPSVVVRGDLPNRFATTKRYSEDYLLWLDILASGRRVFLFEAALTCAFKRSFGAAGLSAQLWRMQRGELDCYRRLAAAGAITTGTRLGLQLLSWGKFGRRLLVTLPLKLRRHGVAVGGRRADAAKSERSEPAGDVPAA